MKVLYSTDYYPGGFQMGGRTLNINTYGFGHNGQRRTAELYDDHYTAQYWEYDSRTMRRWNVDPKPQISISDYACFGNNPIMNADVNGDIFGGKTKEDAEKAKTQMENTLGEGGKAFVERYYTIDKDNVFRLKDGYDKATIQNEMRNWMNNRGKKYGKDGTNVEEGSKHKYKRKQQAMAMGYTKVITATDYTVTVNFDANLFPGQSEYDYITGEMVIGTKSNRDLHLGTFKKVKMDDGQEYSTTITQAFVHELLGEAVGWHLFGDYNILLNEFNTIYPGELQKNAKYENMAKYSPKIREYALHCMQAENLYNKSNRLGVEHWILIHSEDYDKIGDIPNAFK